MKTVKVVMLVSIAGNPEPRYGLGDFGFSVGQVVDLHRDLAAHWIAGGLAKRAEADQPELELPKVAEPETTSLEAPETAVLPEAKPSKIVKKK